MALTSIPYLGNSLSESSTAPGPESQAAAPGAAATQSVIEDVFTPSSQNSAAQEAGLFQATQYALFDTPGLAQPLGNTNPVVGPATSSTPAASVASTPSQIQAFNRALAALGLTNHDIEKLDQIATMVNSFSPNAFGDLISQFLFFSQQLQISSAKSQAASNAPSADFQVQSVALQFQGSHGSSTTGAGTHGHMSLNAAGLQLTNVQLSLLNGAGQAIKLSAPHSTSGGVA